jgi:hypothetical protein
MSQALLPMIDSALEQFRSRDLVSAAEVVDVLLDLRIAAIAPDTDSLEQLLEQERRRPSLRWLGRRSTHAGN